jgi:CheY-like chemotaxis protein
MPILSVLYVEDNDALRATVSELIESEGREIVALADAESALAAWGTRSFDVLITDISLPGISGTELARRVLADRPLQWVVFCSGYEYRQAVSLLGPNVRTIPKAFEVEDMDALLDEISTALSATPAR